MKKHTVKKLNDVLNLTGELVNKSKKRIFSDWSNLNFGSCKIDISSR